MTAYATLPELQARLDWTLDGDEARIATSALDDLSDDARYYGRDWPVASVPRMVKNTVLRAAVAYMRNPDGYQQSRAGDETVVWSDTVHQMVQGGVAQFTEAQIRLIRTIAGSTPILSSGPITAYGEVRRHNRRIGGYGYDRYGRDRLDDSYDRTSDGGYVPTGDSYEAFPLFNNATDPY